MKDAKNNKKEVSAIRRVLDVTGQAALVTVSCVGGYFLVPAAAASVGGSMAVAGVAVRYPLFASMFSGVLRQHGAAQAYNAAMAVAPQVSAAIMGAIVSAPAAVDYVRSSGVALTESHSPLALTDAPSAKPLALSYTKEWHAANDKDDVQEVACIQPTSR